MKSDVTSDHFLSHRIVPVVIALLLAVADALEAQTNDQQLTDIRYTEEAVRSPKLVTDDPAAGDFVQVTDRGMFNLQATLSVQGLKEGLSSLTSTESAVTVSVAGTQSTNAPFQISARLQDDPRWSPGKKRARISISDTIEGRTFRAATVGVRIEDRANQSTLRVKVQGRHFRQNQPSLAVGSSVLAAEFLSQPSHFIRLTNGATVTVSFAPAASQPAFTTQGFMTVTGLVVSVEKTFPGVGTPPLSRVTMGANEAED